MPKVIVRLHADIVLPENVTCSLSRRKVWIRGPRGTLFHDFKHSTVTISKKKDHGVTTITVEKCFEKKKVCAVVKTIQGHIKNMVVGVTKGFRYKMKLVYAHFPINATVLEEGKVLQVFHYIGQKQKRRIKVMPGVKIEEPAGTKDELWIEGSDIMRVSQSAASIWQSCRVKDKDIRKFLDGIYVYAKGPMNEEKPI